MPPAPEQLRTLRYSIKDDYRTLIALEDVSAVTISGRRASLYLYLLLI